MEKKQILLVDDESFVLDMMEWYLSSDSDLYGIFRAGSAEEAMDIIGREQIGVVVADVNMPGISGLDLLASLRSRHPHIRVILMTGDKSTNMREEIRKSGCLHFLEKPLEMKELRRLITEELGRKDEGFHGTLKNIRLDDLIQLCCHASINTAIRVSKGGNDGMIFIRDGEIVHAICAEHVGEKAFYEILGWKSGRFETLGEISIPDVSIAASCHHLLMEAARKTDEAGAGDDDEDEEQPEPAPGPSVLTIHPHTIRVLIADDSSLMCRVLGEMLSSDEDIEIVGTAKNGEEALRKTDELLPDVITLDVNMPVMDGSTALKHIMIKKPCPVVILSNAGEKSPIIAPDFLRLGAVNFLHKPVRSKDMDSQRRQLIRSVKMAANARMENYRRTKEPKILPDKDRTEPTASCEFLAIIVSGPGGYCELLDLICGAGKDPEICFAALQTMPSEFVAQLAEYLHPRSRLTVSPLGPDISFRGGCCYVGSNDVEDDAFETLTNFVADSFSGKTMIVLLSGAYVGNGEGLRRIRQKGGQVMVQKVSSCIVPEPLESVIRDHLADSEANIPDIAAMIANKAGFR